MMVFSEASGHVGTRGMGQGHHSGRGKRIAGRWGGGGVLVCNSNSEWVRPISVGEQPTGRPTKVKVVMAEASGHVGTRRTG